MPHEHTKAVTYTLPIIFSTTDTKSKQTIKFLPYAQMQELIQYDSYKHTQTHTPAMSETQRVPMVKATLKVSVVILPSVLLDSSVILYGLQDVCHPLPPSLPPVCFKKNPTLIVGVWSGCV